MRAVVTRVNSASVSIGGAVVGEIGRGFLILLGVAPGDTPALCKKLAEKILSPVEKVQYDAAPDKAKALLTFWVLKEAAAKLNGRGLRGYPKDTAFSLDDPRVREMDGCLVAIMT